MPMTFSQPGQQLQQLQQQQAAQQQVAQQQVQQLQQQMQMRLMLQQAQQMQQQQQQQQPQFGGGMQGNLPLGQLQSSLPAASRVNPVGFPPQRPNAGAAAGVNAAQLQVSRLLNLYRFGRCNAKISQ